MVLLSIVVHSSYIHSDLPFDVDEPLLHLAEPVLHLYHVPGRLLCVRVGLELHGFLLDLPVNPDDLLVGALLPDSARVRDVLLPRGPARRGLAVRDQDHAY